MASDISTPQKRMKRDRHTKKSSLGKREHPDSDAKNRALKWTVKRRHYQLRASESREMQKAFLRCIKKQFNE